MALKPAEFVYLSSCLGGFFFGLYSGIFALYLQYHGSQKGTNKGKNILLYTLSVLYVLSVATIALDITETVIIFGNNTSKIYYYLYIIHGIIFACCDFAAQSILIYRCWIVWGHNIRIVIVPSFLTFVFLVIWIAGTTPRLIVIENQVKDTQLDAMTLESNSTPLYLYILGMTGIAVSMTVNALVTGLIVFRIVKVFWEVRTSAEDKNLAITGGSTLRPIIFILLESGMALFSIQLIRLVVTPVNTHTEGVIFYLILFIHEMLNGITPTIIIVRVSMGWSFHDKDSMEASIGSLVCVPPNPNPNPETGSLGIVESDQESRNEDDEVQLSDWDIQMVER